MEPKSLKRYAWLSIAAALSTILLKGIAWRLTDGGFTKAYRTQSSRATTTVDELIGGRAHDQ